MYVRLSFSKTLSSFCFDDSFFSFNFGHFISIYVIWIFRRCFRLFHHSNRVEMLHAFFNFQHMFEWCLLKVLTILFRFKGQLFLSSIIFIYLALWMTKKSLHYFNINLGLQIKRQFFMQFEKPWIKWTITWIWSLKSALCGNAWKWKANSKWNGWPSDILDLIL